MTLVAKGLMDLASPAVSGTSVYANGLRKINFLCIKLEINQGYSARSTNHQYLAIPGKNYNNAVK